MHSFQIGTVVVVNRYLNDPVEAVVAKKFLFFYKIMWEEAVPQPFATLFQLWYPTWRLLPRPQRGLYVDEQ